MANDDAFQLMACCHNLTQCGIEVKKTINGLEALQSCMAQNSTFDFILLDLNMPIVDGYEACRQMKQFFDHEGQLFVVENRVKIPLLIAFSGFVDADTEKSARPLDLI